MTRSTRALLLRGVVSASLLLVLAVVVDVDAVGSTLLRLRPKWTIAAFALTVLQVAASAARWSYTARRLGIRLPFRRALSEYYLASFLNQVLPGGVLGDVSRAWRHARSSTWTLGDPSSAPAALRSVHAVVLERLSGQIAMTVVAMLSAAFLGGPRMLATLAAVLLAAAVLLRAVGRYDRLPGAASLLGDARAALGGSALPVQLATSLLVVGSYLAVYLIAARAVGVTTPSLTLLPLVAPVLVTMLLPVTVAGWGVREGAAAALWSAVGLTPEDGIAISVAYGVIVLVGTLPGAGVMLLTLRRERDRDRPRDRPRVETSGSEGVAPRPASRSAGA